MTESVNKLFCVKLRTRQFFGVAKAFVCFLMILLAAISGCQRNEVPKANPGQDDNRVTRLTRNDSRNGQAFWSPNGKTISFISNQGGSWQIWTMDSDGNNLKQITSDKNKIPSWPCWHNNENKIIYYLGQGEKFDIVSIDLTTGKDAYVVHSRQNISNFRPVLSSDNKILLFDRVGETQPRNHDIYTIDLETSELTRLTSDNGYDSDARWSPGNKKIVFHSDRDSSKEFYTQVYIMDRNGEGIRKLTNDSTVNSYPSWSPDGKRIVYVSEVDGNEDLWLMNADGSAKRQLTIFAGKDSEPTWSPDGKKILFCTGRYGEESIELAILTLND